MACLHDESDARWMLMIWTFVMTHLFLRTNEALRRQIFHIQKKNYDQVKKLMQITIPMNLHKRNLAISLCNYANNNANLHNISKQISPGSILNFNVKAVSERNTTTFGRSAAMGIHELCLRWMASILYVWSSKGSSDKRPR